MKEEKARNRQDSAQRAMEATKAAHNDQEADFWRGQASKAETEANACADMIEANKQATKEMIAAHTR